MSPSYSSPSLSMHQKASNYDELSMQQSLLFADSLKELKNLRSQLYSAAEYFELTYLNDNHKKMVVNTLRNYALKALVNTIDHLGSVAYKVNDLLDEKVDEVFAAELRLSCIEQTTRTCRERIDHQGLAQQTLVMAIPKYHKRYKLPVGKSISESGKQAAVFYQEMDLLEVEDCEIEKLQTVIHSKIKGRSCSLRKTSSASSSSRARSSSPSFRKMHFLSPSEKASATEKRRAISPVSTSNHFVRSGSFSCRPVSRNSSIRRMYPSEPQKSASMRLHAERSDGTELDHNPSRSRSLLKSLLSRRSLRDDNMLYNYLDEY